LVFRTTRMAEGDAWTSGGEGRSFVEVGRFNVCPLHPPPPRVLRAKTHTTHDEVSVLVGPVVVVKEREEGN